MRLGILLLAAVSCALAATGNTRTCLVGNLLIDNNVITSRSVEEKQCSGLCQKQTIKSEHGALVLLSCEENKLKSFINQGQHCSSSDLESSCFCEEDQCNRVDMQERLLEKNVAAPNDILCYVGFYGNNSFSAGDTVTCSAGNVCTSVEGVYQGYQVGVYACMPQALCDNLFNNQLTTGTNCTSLQNSNIKGCCCYSQNCLNLAPVTPPTQETIKTNNITCYQGITINGVALTSGGYSQCYGECGSARIRTVYNGNNVWGEVFVCDPVDIFTSLNLDNECKTIDVESIANVSTGLITGCACNTDKCIDPVVVPPVYPIKQLKCATGIYNGSTWLGAETNCQGRCGRLKFKVNSQNVAYYTCMPYDVCAGFGLESSEGLTYNPPQDQELEVYCCSATNNCNADQPAVLQSINNTAVSTAKYPVLCYGGIWVNGVSISNSAYGLCQGECASASFQTSFAGQTHNATIYTCDPVTMCQQAGISNDCQSVLGGIDACCCDNDLCLDPNRGGHRPMLRCYSGISIPQDNYNNGGDQVCDGWCASLNSVVNNKNTTVYYCSPVNVCRYFDLGFGGSNGNCASIPGADPSVVGCCCSDSDNCLAPAGVNVTAIPARPDPQIVCYQGIHINGYNMTNPFFTICSGECVSVSFGGTINSVNHYAELFTCDPSSSCSAMGLRNNCSTIDDGVSACCCDSDECIDPRVNRYPGTQLNCYVGIESHQNKFNVGAAVDCDGYCANATAVVGDDVVSIYHCAPRSLCRSLSLDNSNGAFHLDRQVNVSCCDYDSYCNVADVNTKNMTVQPNEAPHVCYSGVFLGTTAISDGGWIACQGDCVSITLNATLNGNYTDASIYTCDPSVVCRNLLTTNRCKQLEEGLEACCCDSDACLDPTTNPRRKPYGDGNLCYIGAYMYDSNGRTILNVGGEEYCEGNCASMSSRIGNSNFTAYACVPNYMCTYLGLYNDCESTFVDRTISACCCTNSPNCNLYQLPQPPPPDHPRGKPKREFPITCPAGLVIDNAYATPVEFQVCDGDCASITINGTVGNDFHVATLYTCDPQSVCYQLGLNNNCGMPEPGLSACCCDTNACLDPLRNKTVPTPPLTCYVGLYSNSIQTGAEQSCDGKCASINAQIANDNVTLFSCVPHSLCRSLEIYDECIRMDPYYPEFLACCCDNTDNCNVQLSHLNGKINTSLPLAPLNDYPISCYSGLFINGTAYSASGWQTCQGDCVSVSITSQFNGFVGTASLYTCDPSLICHNLNMNNNCTTLENGVTGCCCNTNGCLDPTKTPPRTPGNPLVCYTGLYSNYTVNGEPLNVGEEIQCTGKCSSISGIVNGYMVNSFHCVPASVCRSLELYDDCKPVYQDRDVNACCCDNADNCNVANFTIPPPPPPSRTTDYAIACYSGLYVNGVAVTTMTLGACQGQCASMSLNTTYGNQQTVATLYGCDPTAVCEVLGMENRCASPEPGITGCCCDTDLCLDPTKNKTVPSGSRKCFAGIYAKGSAVGSEVVCPGKCASLSATVNNDNVTVLGCVTDTICRSLELYDECNSIQMDRAVTGCCCDNYDDCNVDLSGLTDKINTSMNANNLRDYPIACYSGLFINDHPYADAGWQTCLGDCVSATLSTSFNGVTTNATLYTCDPVSACFQMGMNNNCTTIEPGLSGCCCSTDGCINPTYNPPRTPGNPLLCYVGIQSTYNNGISLGGESVCDGQCAVLTGVVANQNVTTYHCVPDTVCKSLELQNSCRPIYNDRDVSTCCCNNADNCNLIDPQIVPGPIQLPDFPTACYAGLVVNGEPYTALTLSGCYGDCASVTLTSTLANNQSHTATLYTCDPTMVCNQFGLSNACHTLEPGVTGCCCDSDACLNPYTDTWPGPLNCYVGIYTSDNKINTGATVPCDGYCGSLETSIGGTLYKSYHCVPKEICKSLGLNNERRTISTDRDVTGYCCTSGSNCNVKEDAVNATNVVTPFTGDPIACRSSVYLNGALVTEESFTACYGQCATVSYAANSTGVLTMYTCDPTTLCDSLGLSDSCTSIDGGLSGCCCTTDNCVGPNVSPTPQTGSATSVSVSLIAALAAVYIAIQ